MRERHVRRFGGEPALHAVIVGVFLSGQALYAQTASPGAVGEMPLPGGLQAAVATLDEPVAPDRSQFLLDIIRRTHRSSVVPKNDPREAALAPLLAHLDGAATAGTVDDAAETLPLPLPEPIWIDTVFGGRATRRTLAASILGSRAAALFYGGLLALDDETRAFMAERPEVIADVVTRHPAAFMIAAPGFRVANGRVRVPGGVDAEPAWTALTGADASHPEPFLRALLSQNDGLLAYFFASLTQLTAPRLRRALDLDASDPVRRAEAARRLLGVYGRLAPGWKVDERTFWRPVLDPALLLADLPVDEQGRPMLPGTRRFWALALAETLPAPDNAAHDEHDAMDPPLDFASLAEQVFQGDQAERRRRYDMVLFASRLFARGSTLSRDAVEAVHAAGTYPALIATLERAGLRDVPAYAAAARRAAALSSINDAARAARTLAQYQGALAVVTRAVLRGSLSPDALSSLVSSLSAINTTPRGDYEGRVVRWIEAELLPRLPPAAASAAADANGPGDALAGAAGPLERDLLRLAAGLTARDVRIVEWEGTRYRVDLAGADATRMMRLIGNDRRPYLSSARTAAALADTIAEAGLSRDSLRQHADALRHLAEAVPLDRCRDVASDFQRAARDGDVASGTRLAAALRLLSDDLLARGLKELVYAAAMGQPDRSAISADAAASRHEFGQPSAIVRHVAWRMPAAGGDPIRGWRVTGSLLGLDVRLAEFSLVPLSAKPPRRRPSLNDEDRRAFIESVALVTAASLTDGDRDSIAAALRAGRDRMASLRSRAGVDALADAIRLSPLRRTLLAWMVAHDPVRVASFLSADELLAAGLERASVPAPLHAWGAPAEARLGCLCLAVLDRRPWESLAGRWGSGIFASGFPDLNLRLAELLADMQMPAALLGPVLTSAMLEFVNSAASRDEDDRRGLIDYVQALSTERLEQYLALLTTDGPLVPVGETTGRSARSGVTR